MTVTLIDWISSVIGPSSDFDFLIVLCACILLVIAFTCALSMVIGIVFAIFKRN